MVPRSSQEGPGHPVLPAGVAAAPIETEPLPLPPRHATLLDDILAAPRTDATGRLDQFLAETPPAKPLRLGLGPLDTASGLDLSRQASQQHALSIAALDDLLSRQVDAV